MRVIIVEDDPSDFDFVSKTIRENVESVTIDQMWSECEFVAALPTFAANPPDLILIDLFLPWTTPDKLATSPPRPESYTFDGAGIRCAIQASQAECLKHSMIILQSALDESVLVPRIQQMPENLLVMSKSRLEESLAKLIRSIVLGQGGQLAARPSSTEIFVVHGHDDEAKNAVARLIQQVGGVDIVLRDLPNAGRTIIEKFEDYAKVSFVVVLLTPDDVGGKVAGDMKPRSRQNVIFELGFFIAKLGRSRVAVLSKGNIELPSDIESLICIRMDTEGAWQMRLLREMRAAGLNLDFANAF